MSRRLRHHQFASRQYHDVLALCATVLMLICLEFSFGGLPGGSNLGPSLASAEAFGAPSSASPPIALTGPRSLAIIAGLSEGRQRTAQLVEPGDAYWSASASSRSEGIAVVGPRSTLAPARGLLAVRAPPHLGA